MAVLGPMVKDLREMALPKADCNFFHLNALPADAVLLTLAAASFASLPASAFGILGGAATGAFGDPGPTGIAGLAGACLGEALPEEVDACPYLRKCFISCGGVFFASISSKRVSLCCFRIASMALAKLCANAPELCSFPASPRLACLLVSPAVIAAFARSTSMVRIMVKCPCLTKTKLSTTSPCLTKISLPPSLRSLNKFAIAERSFIVTRCRSMASKTLGNLSKNRTLSSVKRL
mmetsp:Transcript_92517/g.299097  ORF Transcript_92517/g.299097 Transcript_92517/m.299097 type:complete len:235 (+) Transcript_92517:1551-2255(+)